MMFRLLAFAALALPTSIAAQQVPAPNYVFFDWGKNELSGDAKAALNKVAAEYAAKGSGHVVLAAYTDRSGDARANIIISRKRGELVKAFLTTKGVPVDAIRVQAYGEDHPFIVTEDDVREVQNRRVDLWIVD